MNSKLTITDAPTCSLTLRQEKRYAASTDPLFAGEE